MAGTSPAMTTGKRGNISHHAVTLYADLNRTAGGKPGHDDRADRLREFEHQGIVEPPGPGSDKTS